MNLVVNLLAVLAYLCAYLFIIRAIPKIGIPKARYWSGGFVGFGVLISLFVGYVTGDSLNMKVWAVAIFVYLFVLKIAENRYLKGR